MNKPAACLTTKLNNKLKFTAKEGLRDLTNMEVVKSHQPALMTKTCHYDCFTDDLFNVVHV